MRTPLFVLTLALAGNTAFAQDSVRLNTPLPEPGQSVVQTQLKKPGEPADPRNSARPEPVPAASPVAPAAGDARPTIPAATATGGSTPASGPATGSGASAALPPVAAQTLPAVAPSTPGLVPGQPAKVYTTLAQAKADGIDPLGEMKAIAPPPAPEAPAVGFDWRAPASWPAWAREHPQDAALFGGGAFAVLMLLVLGLRRRAPAEE